MELIIILIVVLAVVVGFTIYAVVDSLLFNWRLAKYAAFRVALEAQEDEWERQRLRGMDG